MSEPPAVLVTDLVKRYAGQPVVHGVNLTVERGTVTAVLGPNGAGKTTTIECCEGLRNPDGGTVRVLGRNPATESGELRPRVGVMLQDGGLPSGARALAVLEHVSAMYARPRDTGELAERLGLHAFARTPVRRLSGGQRQRLALATAVVGRPELVFLDEPSAGMDPQSRHAVWDLVRELAADGVSIVLTTHLMDEAEDLADYVYILDHGKVIAAGETRTLLTSGPLSQSISIEAPPGLDTAPLLAALGGNGATWSVTETEPGHYAAAGPVTPAALLAVSHWLADDERLPTQITIGRRTLEDVFLDLTGRRLR